MSSRRLEEIAALCGADLEGDGSQEVSGPAGLADAEAGEITFLAKASYAALLETTRATAVVVGRDLEVHRSDLVLLRCDDPERAFTEVVLAFAPEVPALPEGVDATASVDPSAALGEGVRVGPLASVGPGASLAAGVTVHAGARIGAHAVVGEGAEIHPNVVLYPHTRVGARCVLHAGVVLGSDGFGFLFDGTQWVKTPQVGNVVLGDDVEVGAGSVVDCARFGSTTIGDGAKLDNLVHVGHNVSVGERTLLLAQVGIAGSSSVGSGAILAGQVGVAGHLKIGDGARVAAQAGVTKDLPGGAEYFGYPAGPRMEKLRTVARLERAPAEIKALRAEVEALRERLDSALARLESAVEGAPGAPIDDTPGEENTST